MRSLLLAAACLVAVPGCASGDPAPGLPPAAASETPQTAAPGISPAVVPEPRPPEPPPPRETGDRVDRAIAEFKEYLRTAPDPQGLVNQVRQLCLLEDPRVAVALRPLLLSDKVDDVLRIAVARGIARQGDPGAIEWLFRVVDGKNADKKPGLMAALLEAIGEADAKGNYERLIKYGKRYMDLDSDIAIGAFRAAANWVDAESVGELIKVLTWTDSIRSDLPAAKRANRGRVKPVLLSLLQEMTGQRFDDFRIGRDWWSTARRTPGGWKPPVKGVTDRVEVGPDGTWEDDTGRFSITRPGPAWTLRRPLGERACLVLEAFDEGRRAAWMEVTVMETRNLKSKTAEAMAAEWKGILEPKFKDVKEADWNRPCLVGGVRGVEQIVYAMDPELNAVYMHNAFVEKEGTLYLLMSWFRVGSQASFKYDLDALIRTGFRILR